MDKRNGSQKLKEKQTNKTKNQTHSPHFGKKKCDNNLQSLVFKHTLPSLPYRKIMFKLITMPQTSTARAKD